LNRKLYLIRSGSTRFGGAENYLRRFSEALEKEKIDYQIINSSFPKILPSWIRALLFNIQLHLTKRDKFYFSLERITCADIYRAGDGVHKVFLSIEKKSILNLLHPTYLYLERHCLKNAKQIIANSKMVKNEIIKTYNLNPNNINVIHNGIKLNEIDFEKSFKKISSEFSITQDQSVLLYVGSGFKRKGVEEFLRIFSELKTINIVGFIVGKERNMEYYRTLSKNLKIDKQIYFTGPRTDVNDFYSISDIFLFPTHYDPFSNVVLEAMNFKNVVYTTSTNGASEILNKDFILERPYDKKVVASIDKILGNKTALEGEKRNNRKISKSFSIQKNLTKTLKVIKKIEK
jgi:UDP-glucose:(heptosyl)LPS alpha-1,3-glucosyltransferase